VWTGGSNTVWGEGGNWSLGYAPIEADFVRIPGSLSRYPVMESSKTIDGLEIGSGASLALNGFNLTVTTNAAISGA